MEISCSASLQRMHLDLICLGSQRWDGGTCWAERASLAGSICRSSQRSASAHETFPFSHGGYPQIIHFRWGCSTNVMVSSWNHIPMMWSTISTISINAARIFHEINHPASSDKGVAPWHWKPSDNGHTTAASYWTNQSGVSVVSSSQWSLMHVYKSCIVAEQVCMSKIFKDSDPNICFRFLPSMGKKNKNMESDNHGLVTFTRASEWWDSQKSTCRRCRRRPRNLSALYTTESLGKLLWMVAKSCSW